MGTRQSSTEEQQALFHLYAQQQYAQQQQYGLLGTVFSDTTSSSTLPQEYDSFFQYQPYSTGFGVQLDRRIIKFNRINDVIEIPEGADIRDYRYEPLDDLRIEVAKWLYN